MYKRIVKVILIGILFYSCGSKNDECRTKIDSFISKNEESNFSDLYGFSAESTWRKKDENGKRRVYRIVYINEAKEKYKIPSFQNFTDLDIESDTLIDLNSFALELGYSQLEGKEVAKRYADEIIELINSSDIKSIHSQKHLGEFMEFTLVTGCSIWYKENGARLSDEMDKAFNSAYRIRPNWYVLNRTAESSQLIELYKRD